jgi:small-conductance mechanosensitive channel
MPRSRAAFVRAGVTAAVVLVASIVVQQVQQKPLFPNQTENKAFLALILLVALAAGFASIRGLVEGVFGTVSDQRWLLWRNLASWTLYALLVLLIASEAGLNISGLLVGGAIVGVVVAAASQASLGNFFSGLVILASRPFTIGETIRVRSALAGGTEYEGTVVDARAFYTTLVTADGQLLRMPNSAVIQSVIVVGGLPLQAELEVELPEGATIGSVRQHLQESLPEGTVLEVRPRSLDASAHRLTCEVRVRSRRSIPDHELAEALLGAVEAAA